MVWADAVDDEDDVQSNIIGDACADEFLRLNLQTPELLAHDSCWVLVRHQIASVLLRGHYQKAAVRLAGVALTEASGDAGNSSGTGLTYCDILVQSIVRRLRTTARTVILPFDRPSQGQMSERLTMATTLSKRGEAWSVLTKRQRQRRREATYWDKVLLHTLAQLKKMKCKRFILSYHADNAALQSARNEGPLRYRDTCLVNALRAHRFKIDFEANGPFFAVRDGSKMLRPFRHSIAAAPLVDVFQPGMYILAFDAHFVGLRNGDDGLQINQTHRSHAWQDAHVSDRFAAALRTCPSTGKLLLNLSCVDALFKIHDLGPDQAPCVAPEADCCGGSNRPSPERRSAARNSVAKQVILPDEIVLKLPQCFFSFEFLSRLAACSRWLLKHVADRLTWEQMDLEVDIPEFLHDMSALRHMSKLWTLARTVTLTQPQLACLDPMFDKILLRWQAERIPFLGERSCGYMSTQTLLGCARFILKVPRDVRVITLGVKSPMGARKLFFQIREAFTERMCFTFGMSGRPHDAEPVAFPADVCFAEMFNEVMMMWHPRSFALKINERVFGPVQLRPDLPNGPGSQALPFVWAINPKRIPKRPDLEMLPLQTPVLPSAVCLCLVCGQEAGLSQRDWRVCPECNTWVCKEHTEHSPHMQCPGCPSSLAEYVGGAVQGPSLPTDIVLHMPSYFSSYACLRNLSAASKTCFAAVSSGEAWRKELANGKGGSRPLTPHELQRVEASRVFHARWQNGFVPCQGSKLRLLSSDEPVVNLNMRLADFRKARPDVSFMRLQRNRPHPRDARIVFYPETHTYLIDGEPSMSSVTAVIHQYANPFEPEAVIHRMMMGSKWPRPEYSRAEAGQLVPFTASEIKEKWRQSAEEAALLGTWTHLKIECVLNGGSLQEFGVEIDLFFRFLQTQCPRLLAYRTEWCIWGTEERLAGCIDFAAMNAAGHLVLFDWKRSKNLRSKYSNPWQTMRGCLSHLPDCAGVHYRLQLNVYRHLLEKYYGFTVSAMYVVCVHPDNVSQPFVDTVPHLCKETAAIMAAQVEEARWAREICREVADGAHENHDAVGGSATAKRWDAHSDLVRRYEAVILQFPCTIDIFPAPSDYCHAGKRKWERAMRNARVVLTMLDQEMYYILYMFLHAEYKIVLPHPLINFNAAEWVTEVATLVRLADHERRRLGAANRQPQDLPGGSLPHELLRSIGVAYSCPEHILQLQACCRRLREMVLDPASWRDLCIHLDSLADVSYRQFVMSIRMIPTWSEASEDAIGGSCSRAFNEAADDASSIRNLVAQRRMSEQFPDLSEYMRRLMTATLTALTLRTMDVLLREHSTVLFATEKVQDVMMDYVGGAAAGSAAEASQESFGRRVDQELAEAVSLMDGLSQQLKQERIEEEAAEVVLEGEEDVAEKAWAALKKRRLLPGAATSDEDFRQLFARLEDVRSVFQNEQPEMLHDSDSIVQMVSRHKTRIANKYPSVSTYMTKLMTAAVAVLALRTVDIFQRESAIMLWIMEGETHMRFHHGDCYILHASGAFQHYKGLFRKLPANTRRNEHDVLQAVSSLLDAADSEQSFLDACRLAAVSCKGDSLLKGRKQAADDVDDAGEEVPSNLWNIYCARTIIAIKRNIIRELSDDKLVSYMIEFCERPMAQAAGCCYNDCCVEMPAGGSARQVQRASVNDIYVHIPHNIKCVVPDHVLERLLKFYRQTFWGNVDAFKCCQAAQALAKRGLNVVRLFIGLSSGGVGQSLYSSHLEAMYGHNFAYFDPNIWYNEDEMRKQIEQLNGQEAPGTNRRLREDLYKKFMSGEGWKRLEANRFFTFSNVTTPEQLKDCVQMIENYVQWGGDHGLTEKTMREACGMPPRDVRANASRAQAIIQVDEDDDKDGDGADPNKEWDSLRKFITNHLLGAERFDVTKPMLVRLKFPCGPNVSKDELIKAMVSNGVLVEAVARGKTAEVYRPLINCSNLAAVLDLRNMDSQMIFSELLHLKNFADYVQGCPARRENALVLGKFYSSVKPPSSGRGRPSKSGGDSCIDSLHDRGRKLLGQEDLFDELLAEFAGSSQTPRSSSFKRRRTKSKVLLDVKEEAEDAKPCFDETCCVQRTYTYPAVVSFRSRKSVRGTGVQKFCRQAQVHLTSGSVDLDIENALFTLMHQLMMKLKLSPPPPDVVLRTLRRCAQDRDGICAETLRMSKEDGKLLLIKIFNGELSNASIYCRWLAVSLFPDEYERLQHPPQGTQTEKKHFPEATLLSHLYFIVEDVVISTCAECLSRDKPQHLSLHYDGVRVSRPATERVEDLCDRLSLRVKAATGFEVVIREKQHLTLLQIISEAATSCEESSLLPDAGLRQCGNCIPAAVGLLLNSTEEVEAKLSTNTRAENPSCPTLRSYKDCESLLSVRFLPLVPDSESALPDWQPGNFLLHTENGGKPHCVGVCISDDLPVKILDARKTLQVDVPTLQRALASGLDHKTCVVFKLGSRADSIDESDTWSEEALLTLLSLEAGADNFISVSSDDELPEIQILSSDSDEGEDHDQTWLDDTAQVVVDTSLLAQLENEVEDFLRASSKKDSKANLRCPFCPWRRLRGHDRVRDHVRKYHTATKQFCCSGTKQLRVVLSLHDTDMFACVKGTSYLRRSADLIRSQVCEAPSTTANEIDRHVRLILDGSGPRFVAVSEMSHLSLRRVGNILSTHAFAEKLFREILLHASKVASVWPRLMMEATSSGCSLVNMFPTHSSSWWPIVEDIFSSPVVTALTRRLLDECVLHNEFRFLSVDGTVKCILPTMGQNKYSADAKKRKQGDCFPSSETIYRVITVRGATGAVVALLPSPSEKASFVAERLGQSLPPAALQQVEHVATDAPSGELFHELSAIMPSLKSLCLDPLHLAMKYEYSTGRHRTPGSAALRACLNKFNNVSPRASSVAFGLMFAGACEKGAGCYAKCFSLGD
ncbi:unnamed protein product, partial [Symbiodinium sp. KB8]